MATPSELDALLGEFAQRVKDLAVVGPLRMPIEALRDRSSATYSDWSSASGVYFFEQEGRVQYIGRALPGTGLKARVHNQCNAFGDEKWDTVIKNDGVPTTVGVISLSSVDWYWAAALEAYLISRCQPPHNRRSS